ncbi:MAG TPA: DUF2283 domain-containing protein [Acetobacteraceae bacterium]|nr:DUF2283 domain-containing protein [Acetobacteraceae bacterium]
MITTSYDPEADALSIRFAPKGAEVAETREVQPDVASDPDAAPRRSELIATLDDAERLMLKLMSRRQDMPAEARAQLRGGASLIGQLVARCQKPR